MTGFEHFWSQGDLITRGVAVLLLAMSVSAWVVIFWKGWLLRRVSSDMARAISAFWAASSMTQGHAQLLSFDREGVVGPLLVAALAKPRSDTLESKGQVDSQLTRRLRDALHGVVAQLQFGQVLLASIGSTAPFIGLFGTVWGIMGAFTSLGNVQQVTLAMVAPGIAEALIATAAGLFAAIPAVVGYNRFADQVSRLELRYNTFMEEFSTILQRHVQPHLQVQRTG